MKMIDAENRRCDNGELVRWNPAREMMSLRDAMDRLFEESFLRPGFFGWGKPRRAALPLDMYETENEVVVKAPCPASSRRTSR